MNPLSRNRPRQRRPPILITHDGHTRSINQWVKLTGIPYRTIWDRYHSGVTSGAELFARGRTKREPQVQVSDTKELNDVKREAEHKRLDLSKQRQSRARSTYERVAAEHAAAMSAPLIDASLLTAAERAANAMRVRNSGQRSWRVTGASMGAAL